MRVNVRLKVMPYVGKSGCTEEGGADEADCEEDGQEAGGRYHSADGEVLDAREAKHDEQTQCEKDKADHDVLNGSGGLDVEHAGNEDDGNCDNTGHLRRQAREYSRQILSGSKTENTEVQHFHDLVPLPQEAQSRVHKAGNIHISAPKSAT